MWHVEPIDETAANALAGQLLIAPPLARVLIVRGYRTPEPARRFLDPRLADLHPAADLPDMAGAVDRICAALHRKEPILVWGHEDLDGVSSVVCLRETLRDLHGVTSHYIPAKGAERHGLNPTRLREFAQQGVRLVITVDCGITNVEETSEIRSSGVDVIITDHHEVLDKLPGATAVVDPKRPDSRYPFPSLAGVGVALKAALAVAQHELGVTAEEFFSAKPELLTMAALGSIADRVPLIDENRILVRFGLEQMRRTRLVALLAVLDACGIQAHEVTVSRFVSDLMPLFASADGNTSVEMFLSDDPAVARSWVRSLWDRYQAWREEAKNTLAYAEQLVDLAPGIIFVRSERLSLRALGHCASKLKDEYLLPVVVMGKRGNEWVGECRGVDGVNLVDLLKANARYFRDFGGHAKACGFTISDERVEAFIADAKDYAARSFAGRITETRDAKPEAAVHLSEVADDFRRLSPLGEGNPAPVLISPATPLECRDGQVFCPVAPQLRIVADGPALLGPGDYDVLYELDDNLMVRIKGVHANRS